MILKEAMCRVCAVLLIIHCLASLLSNLCFLSSLSTLIILSSFKSCRFRLTCCYSLLAQTNFSVGVKLAHVICLALTHCLVSLWPEVHDPLRDPCFWISPTWMFVFLLLLLVQDWHTDKGINRRNTSSRYTFKFSYTNLVLYTVCKYCNHVA